ncbi:MAG: PP2C family protein-serine/threonine phosphatase [Phycisphaerales bacterium JB039]
MTSQWHSGAFTMEFGHEFEVERERWLRRRFLWYAGVVGALGLIGLLVGLAGLLMGSSGSAGVDIRTSWSGRGAVWVTFGASFLGTALYVAAFIYAWRHKLARPTLVRIVQGLIIANGALALCASAAASAAVPPAQAGGSVGLQWALQIFTTHLFACLFLPLTPRESLRPLIPLLVVYAVIAVFSGDSWIVKLVTLLLLPLIGAPGALICWYRHGKFREKFTNRMLKSRFGALRQELSNARMIHEALFPQPGCCGSISFSYIYEPMREIGGDFLYAAFGRHAEDDAAPLNLVVIDVTGHGIAAALTVNRLHGELERIYAERPDTSPGEALSLLNRYVHLTLAQHSIYATALCVRIDPAAGVLEYASGGHPPAFLRAVDGTVHELESTALVLGAAPTEAFETDTSRRPFGPGDSLIAYTDGVIEAPGRDGSMLRIDGVRRLVAAAGATQGGWSQHIHEAVRSHRHGPAPDDTLIIEIACGLPTARPRPAPPPRTKTAAAVSS